MKLVEDHENDTILYLYRLRFDVAPELDDIHFEGFYDEAGIGELVKFRGGLPGPGGWSESSRANEWRRWPCRYAQHAAIRRRVDRTSAL